MLRFSCSFFNYLDYEAKIVLISVFLHLSCWSFRLLIVSLRTRFPKPMQLFIFEATNSIASLTPSTILLWSVGIAETGSLLPLLVLG